MSVRLRSLLLTAALIVVGAAFLVQLQVLLVSRPRPVYVVNLLGLGAIFWWLWRSASAGGGSRAGRSRVLRGPRPTAQRAGPAEDVPPSALRTARREARQRWPEFAAAFEGRSEGERFAVLVAWGADGSERAWVHVHAMEGGRIYGMVARDPLGREATGSGERAVVVVEDVQDWLIVRSGEAVGGFTLRAPRERLEGDDREG